MESRDNNLQNKDIASKNTNKRTEDEIEKLLELVMGTHQKLCENTELVLFF